MSDKVFITGATGNIGARAVTKLVEAGVATTVFARNEEKAKQIFEKEFKTGLLSFVKGDYDDEAAFTEGIKGHTRLLLLVANLGSMAEIKGKLARAAFAAGVKQIVDISSFTVKHLRKSGEISWAHSTGEEVLAKAASETGNSVVYLRPGNFMTNHLHGPNYTIKNMNKIFGVGGPEQKTTLVDTDDIADVAVSVFLDPISKHHNSVYDIQTEVVSNTQRAEIFSKVLGRTIEYVQQDIPTFYNNLIKNGFPHKFAYDFVSLGLFDFVDPTPQIEILLKRPPGKFEDWVKANRSAFE